MKGKDEKQLTFPKDPRKFNKLKRHNPTEGSYKIQILQCMASTSQYIMKNSDTCSTCPIKCINPNTGKRYDFSSKCTCPIYSSICNVAYSAAASFDKISLYYVSMLKFKKEARLNQSDLDKTEKLQSYCQHCYCCKMQSVYG